MSAFKSAMNEPRFSYHGTSPRPEEGAPTVVGDLPLAQRLAETEQALAKLQQTVESQNFAIGQLVDALARSRQAAWRTQAARLKHALRGTAHWANAKRLRDLHYKKGLTLRSVAGAVVRSLTNRWPRGYSAPAERRVCFVGDGFAGSWRMRAQQISRTRPQWVAKALRPMWPINWSKYDVVVFVKRFDWELAEMLRRRGHKVVYDVIDPWKQPEDGLKHPTLPEVLDYFRGLLTGMPVDGVIFPNQTMFDDLHEIVPNPVMIYHHSRPELVAVPLRPEVRVVGYEGCPSYLGPWRETIEQICRSLGLQFVVNPRSLNDIDIGFVARAGDHGSLMAKRYKSNVKLANLLAAGIPALVQSGEAAYAETGIGLVEFFKTPRELEAALLGLLPLEARQRARSRMLAASLPFAIDAIAQQYEEYFERLLAPQERHRRAGDYPALRAA